jgi:Holliday junction resolvase RusA-like endonuclease
MLSLAEPAIAPSSRLPDAVIELAGEPRGKGRPRSRVAHRPSGSQFIAVYTDPETKSYEGALRWTAARAMRGHSPFHHALKVRVTAVFSVPRSWSAKRRSRAIAGQLRPVVKPDADNILKTLDALNKIVWLDDSQIVECLVEKHYGELPLLRVEVWQHVGLL